jgi:Holliday junction resolvasome RuvABC endonuclease subunit
MSMLAVGLDLSLRGPGVCVVNGHPDSKIGEGLDAETTMIRAGEDVDGPERLSVVCRSIWSWLHARNALAPGRVFVVEGYAFGATSKAHSIGELGGCVRKMIWESGGNLVIIPPSTLKRFLTGKGVGDKNIVLKHVFKRWGFDVDDDNECDAFGCALLGLVDVGDPEQWSAIELDILTKKVQRHAGKGQTDWHGGGSPRKVAGRPSGRTRRGAGHRSSVLDEDL